MRDSQLWILYTRELKSAFRERSIVVQGVLLPIFMYPVLLWVMFSALVLVQGLNEGFTSRVVVEGPVPDRHASLLDSLAARTDVLVYGWEPEVDGDDDGEVNADSQTRMLQAQQSMDPPADPVAALRDGDLDAILRIDDVPSDSAGAALAGNFVAHIRFDRSETRSSGARSRIEGEVEAYRDRWLADAGAGLGLTESDRRLYAVATENVSSERDVGAMLMGQMLSVFLVIMVALGCFMPSIDTTAGERERSTWETTMTVSASRGDIIRAKYLYVATLGILAGLLNVVAMFASIGAVVQPLLDSNESIQFTIPFLAVPVMMLGAIILALFFSAAMMILASFARTFKDGQAMVTPVYWLIFIPLLLGDSPDTTLTPGIAAIPVANVAMMIKDALKGIYLWPLIGMTVVVNLVLIVLLLLLARRILAFEDFLMGSFDGSMWKFVKERMLGRKPKSGNEAATAAAGD